MGVFPKIIEIMKGLNTSFEIILILVKASRMHWFKCERIIMNLSFWNTQGAEESSYILLLWFRA